MMMRGATLPQRKWRVAAGVSAAAGVGAIGYHSWTRKRTGSSQPVPILLPQPFVDALSGAVGEVAQICMLYPVETLKVRCQVDSVSASHVLRHMLAKHGLGWQLWRRLYSGFSSAALFSMAVGAVHWLSFCMAKRTALDLLPGRPLSAAAASAVPSRIRGSARVEATGVAAQGGQGSQDAGDWMAGLAKSDEGSTAAAGLPAHTACYTDQASPQPTATSSTAAVKLDPAGGASHAHDHLHVSSAHHVHEEEELSHGEAEPCGDGQMGRRTTANLIAAVVGALATALVESPVELFRHRAQAGLISGHLIMEMGKAMRGGGPGALWQGFLPFCMEAFPNDLSELGSYSQLRDCYDHLSRPGESLHAASQVLPQHIWDLAIGGAAGAAAVMASMPFDCVKTYMQTHDTAALGKQSKHQLALFFQTGAAMVRRRGPGALFVGVVPRLVQQVPSSIICWWAVERVQKTLRPFTHTATQGQGSEAGGAH